ncbi:CDP-glucose 4,6-dehydratase [Lentilitoribacter sp. EG35]|uniref:CDP-glucose 4,6-dehydratase n=1 Tax=Lentilitoribacter sp. EG35 TaxID=3234192 RepID=UPI00345FDB30
MENLELSSFGGAFNKKKVLITGHTGFKGAWLTTWLLHLGANVIGYSKDIPTNPSMFETLGLEQKIAHVIGDICDLTSMRKIIVEEKPDYVFHLAAQSIVSVSYADPIDTITTNIVGTANLLEALRDLDHRCIAMFITSDKCYDNKEWIWGYREIEPMGGKDIYSGSKGAAELIIKSYLASFFQAGQNDNIRLGVGRAGNVIGGGDWAKDRIVVDMIKSWADGKPVEIRSPNAIRPWQHVLESLSGYLHLAAELGRRADLHGEPFNFGPKDVENRTVLQLLKDFAQHWGFKDHADAFTIAENRLFNEATLLKLNCEKAMHHLNWEANLDYSEAVKFIADWYQKDLNGSVDMYDLTVQQIHQYEKLAQAKGLSWV